VLNYALVLQAEAGTALGTIHGANEFIMRRHRDAITRLLGAEVVSRGHTDLALGARKFSGNAQRRRKNWLLFHGCFLLSASFGLMEQVLRMPSRQPEYRDGRSHTDFLVNLQIPAALVKTALSNAWGAGTPLERLPLEEIRTLARSRYSSDDWNFRF
jgi:lipoate-protein ligase A